MAASLLLSSGRDPVRVADGLIKRGMKPLEARILLKQWERGINSPLTSSAGRFLDAVAAWLGICQHRSYEGEPAMRLEAAAARGTAVELPIRFVDGSETRHLDVTDLFAQLAGLSSRASVDDVAATAQDCLARGLATLAISRAEGQHISDIVLSGGVAYNHHITSRIREMVESAGYTFHTNQQVPCGDGGVALGQLVAAGLGYRLDSVPSRPCGTCI
jgi:hydrogenase maturation protein HypF